jgi:hypothetical protein
MCDFKDNFGEWMGKGRNLCRGVPSNGTVPLTPSGTAGTDGVMKNKVKKIESLVICWHLFEPILTGKPSKGGKVRLTLVLGSEEITTNNDDFSENLTQRTSVAPCTARKGSIAGTK